MAITNYIPQIWDAHLLENLHPASVVLPTLNRQYEGVAAKGNTVKITGFTSVTIGTYAGSITAQSLVDSSQSLSINQEKYYAYTLDDVDKAQAAGGFAQVQADAAQSLVDDAESYVLTQMGANGTSVGTAALATYSDAYTVILNLRKALAKTKVPPSNRYLAVNPDFSSLLFASGSSLIKVNEYGDSGPIMNGEIGRLLGFTVLETPATGLENASHPAAIAYHGPSVGYVSQLEKSRATTRYDMFGDQIDGLHVYGAKVLRPTAVQTYLAIA